MSIEGIPEGWVALKFDHSVFGDNWIDEMGQIHLHEADLHSKYKRLIIRQIEKPKQYRPFANPEEAEALIGQVLRLKANHKRKSLLIGITLNRFQIGFSRYSLLEAFYCFEKLDGSPFGVEVAS
jgi:hypothetical protein